MGYVLLIDGYYNCRRENHKFSTSFDVRRSTNRFQQQFSQIR